MLNVDEDEFLDKMSQKLTANTVGSLHATMLDLIYAYSLSNLAAETTRQCNFNVIGDHATSIF